MAEEKRSIRQRVDDALTNYLRNTTTDQEILDFYGEGNIIGRKGINPETLITETSDAYKLPGTRPNIKRELPTSESLFGLSGGKESFIDIQNAYDPKTGNPWQMKFEALPFPGSATPTPAATRFLKDFRVPTGTAVDYGFETAPNVGDVNAADIREIETDPRNYQDQRAAYAAENAGKPISESGPLRSTYAEEIERIQARPSAVTRPSGALATPQYWESRGFSQPENLKQETLNTFRDQIMKAEQPFGSVSQLTPVAEGSATLRPGGDPYWRANLYEKAGLAGPMTEVSIRVPYGGSSGNVQMFTRGNERLLPIQPYTEFLGSDASKASAISTEPAADFTPFQKAIGTRNYLLGRNILEGRGSLGGGFRGALSIGAADLIPSREAIQSFYKGDTKEGLQRMAGDFASGIPLALGAGALATTVPAAATLLPPVGVAMTTLAAGAAADEAVKQQTGEGIIPKVRQFLGTETRTGLTDRPKPVRPYVQPSIVPNRDRRNPLIREWQNRLGLAQERFNPSKGEFGFSELLFGR